MAILPRQYYNNCRNGYYSREDGCYRRSSAWSDWARWVVLAVIIIGAFLLFFIFACITARRRRRRGMTPFRGTGWAAGGPPPPGHGPAQYTGAQPAPPYYGGGGNQYNNQPAGQPVYSPPPNQNTYGNTGANQSYFGGQQDGVELQQPNHTYQPQRGGDQVFSPPSGPPPGKDGIVR